MVIANSVKMDTSYGMMIGGHVVAVLILAHRRLALSSLGLNVCNIPRASDELFIPLQVPL